MTADHSYIDKDGTPALHLSFCAFLDVLGFASHIDSSFRNGAGEFVLDRFYEVFTGQLDTILNPKSDRFTRWEIKVFTDNIVLGCPLPTWHAEPEFADMARRIGRYQLQMTLENFFIRGGLSVGQLFMDDNTAFGPALLESYAIESKRSRDPRVVLSADAVDVVNKHIAFYHPKGFAPQNDFILKDVDGEAFINYLESVLVAGPPDGRLVVDTDLLAKHRDIVIQNLTQHRSTPIIWAKYQWVANYHNFFVSECVDWGGCSSDLLIARTYLELSPRRLVQTGSRRRQSVDSSQESSMTLQHISSETLTNVINPNYSRGS